MTPTEAIKEIKYLAGCCPEFKKGKDEVFVRAFNAARHRDNLLTRIYKICMEVKD